MTLNRLQQFLLSGRRIFNLQQDADECGTIENIRKNVDFHGANAWTLVFAIFIASVGLNMNSTAVIIGAMLISPLMGPILGIGLALGINDGTLLRKSFRNLSIAVVISIATSMVYFLLSPLHEAESEILARTYPTFYDVLIAFFGGAAGIVSISRKERGPSVAGVAIATALMPPLCTAGFALSIGNVQFLAGALYLFLINSVFISLSTFLFVRYMGFGKVQNQDQENRQKIRRWIGWVVTIMILPSLFFAWNLLQESRFKIQAQHFTSTEFRGKNFFVVDQAYQYSIRGSQIEVTLAGTPLDARQIDELNGKLEEYKLKDVVLVVRQIGLSENTKLRPKSEFEMEAMRLREYEREIQSLKKLTEDVQIFLPQVMQIMMTEKNIAILWGKKPPSSQRKEIESYLGVNGFASKPILHLLPVR